MPKGTCEICEEHDTFVHVAARSLGGKALICVRCLLLSLDKIDAQPSLPSAQTRIAGK